MVEYIASCASRVKGAWQLLYEDSPSPSQVVCTSRLPDALSLALPCAPPTPPPGLILVRHHHASCEDAPVLCSHWDLRAPEGAQPAEFKANTRRPPTRCMMLATEADYAFMHTYVLCILMDQTIGQTADVRTQALMYAPQLGRGEDRVHCLQKGIPWVRDQRSAEGCLFDMRIDGDDTKQQRLHSSFCRTIWQWHRLRMITTAAGGMPMRQSTFIH